MLSCLDSICACLPRRRRRTHISKSHATQIRQIVDSSPRDLSTSNRAAKTTTTSSGKLVRIGNRWVDPRSASTLQDTIEPESKKAQVIHTENCDTENTVFPSSIEKEKEEEEKRQSEDDEDAISPLRETPTPLQRMRTDGSRRTDR